MASRICLLTLLWIGSSFAVFAQTPAVSAESVHLSFLKPGGAYIVRFPPDREFFQHTTTGVTESYTRGPSGEMENVEPRRYTARIRLDIFKVVGFGGGSWVLMEHPASSEDYARWSGKQRAITRLSSTKTPELENDPDAQDQFKKLREAAARDIPTTKTWVNLDHAITITEVSARSLGLNADD